MKIDDIAKQLANKENQEHYIKHYLEKVQRGAYNKGVKDTEAQQLILSGVMHWVACKEKLPKKDGSYLINWQGIALEAEFYKETEIWISEEGLEYKKVTHWMHLPKTPCV